MEIESMGELTYAELRCVARALRGDDSAVREHLAAGQPIIYRDDDTPPGHVIQRYPDGRCELLRCEAGETSVVCELPSAIPWTV